MNGKERTKRTREFVEYIDFLAFKGVHVPKPTRAWVERRARIEAFLHEEHPDE